MSCPASRPSKLIQFTAALAGGIFLLLLCWKRSSTIQPVAATYFNSVAVSAELMKTEWPELVGKPGEEAKKMIEAEGGHEVRRIQVIPVGHMVTMDFRMDRVRVFVDRAGNVSDPPRIG